MYFLNFKAMITIALNSKIEDYIANRMSETDKVDFEAEMMMDKELEQEVARMILRKMQIERNVEQHIKIAEIERVALNQELKVQNMSLKETIINKWGKLLACLSSN
jgi:hypothetical protein